MSTRTSTRRNGAAADHGGRTLADRLDANEAALGNVADAVDAATVAHQAHNDHVAAEVAALRAEVAGLAAVVANIEQTTNATGLSLATALPKLLDVFGLVTDAADHGVRRTLRARRKAARP